MEVSRQAIQIRQRRRVRAVVVARTDPELDPVIDILRTLRFDPVAARDFQTARCLLLDPPDLLVTQLRLHRYNGLHLVLYAKARRPRTAALVMASHEDCAVRDDAEQIGSTLVVIPTMRHEWVAAVLRTVAQARSSIATECIRPPFERRRGSRRSVDEYLLGSQL